MVLIIAHRGASAHAPENTLLSFRKAMELGADMVELDVQLTSDGELAVIHDGTLDRTTDGTGPVSSFTLEELKELDAGEGQKVPTLNEVLDFMGGRCGLDLELKGRGTAGPAARALKEAIMEGSWREEQFVVTSFNPIELIGFASILPGIRRGLLVEGLTEGAIDAARVLCVSTINPDHNYTTGRFVRECIDASFEVQVWTVNDIGTARRLVDWGVGALITDRPELGRLLNSGGNRA